MPNLHIKSYLLNIDQLNDESFNKLLLGVKKYRKDKIDRLSLKNSKYLSLAVELLIKKACEDFGLDYLKEEIIFNEHGKPSFKSGKYYFNTAHSGKYALCVISDVEVGSDIEEIKEYKSRVADRFFSAKENNYINLSNDKDDMFYRIWTIKESYMKCLGKGFALPMDKFEIDNDECDVKIKNDDSHQFIELKHDNYRIAFCLKVSKKDKEKYLHNTTLVELN